jgi:PAS domain S-box-containing protein
MKTPAEKTRLSKLSGVLAVGALALLCVLFAFGRPMDVAEHDGYRTRLRQLRVLNTELEEDVLRARLGLPERRGTVPEEFAALRARAEELRAFPGFLPEEGQRRLGAVLDDYVRALADNEALLPRLREDTVLRELLDRPASAEAERLITTYLQLYEEALARAERFRIILFAVSLLLVAFVVAVLVRLTRTGAALNALNAELEQRVEERTRALSAANAELRDSEDRKAAILESAPDGIVSLDEASRILEFNPAAERLFRLPREQALGRDFRSVGLAASVTAEQREAVQRALRTDTPPSRTIRLEVPALRADGSSFPSELTLLPVRGDGAPRFTAYVRDMTERKEVERLKNEFVSTVSHELRTPLTSIRGSLGLLEGGVLGELPVQAQDMVRIARTNTERLIRLINDILDLEKMEAGKLELKLQPVDVTEALEATFSGVQAMADTARVRLRAEAGDAGSVRADRDRLIQVLTNLVSNAIKFSPADSGVVVRAARDARGAVRFSVVDQGPGIPPEKRDRLFGKFQQLDSSDTRSKGGTGLGLAISQAIIEQHGGHIEVHGEPGQGATFTFSLPAVRQDSSTVPLMDQSRYNVLVVTTDSELSGLLRGLLTHEGYRVLRSPSLAEATKLIEVGAPDMLVLDTRLLDGEGLDLVRRLREDPRTRELPVMVLAGGSPQEEAIPPLLVDWMVKPFDETRFLQTLRHAIRRPGQARVLVVDDDVATRQVLRAQIERLGAACYEAEDGESAVALARETPPDLILMDVGLPRLDGFEVVDILRQGKGRGTPLIVFTGRELTSKDQHQLTLGITRHLTKARTSEDELMASVKELLNGLLARRDGEKASQLEST